MGNATALLLDVADLWQAEVFAFDLARASLEFTAYCRGQMRGSS